MVIASLGVCNCCNVVRVYTKAVVCADLLLHGLFATIVLGAVGVTKQRFVTQKNITWAMNAFHQ